MTKVRIEINIENCSECPMVKSERTPGAGYALDYFCTMANDKLAMGYIEWESDKKPIPDWCPGR